MIRTYENGAVKKRVMKLTLATALLEGEKHPDLYEDGPCSKAEQIKEGWNARQRCLRIAFGEKAFL